MKAIALTGGIASGKSTVCDILKEHKIPVVSADTLAHQAIRKGTSAFESIVGRYGRKILEATGEIDRKQLGDIVFADRERRKELEALIHPVVIAEIQKMIETGRESGEPLMVFEIPLLFETEMEGGFDEIWVVSVNPGVQEERLKSRNRLSETEARKRIAAQLPLAVKEGKADRIIYNNGGIEAIRLEVSQILDDLGVSNCIND